MAKSTFVRGAKKLDTSIYEQEVLTIEINQSNPRDIKKLENLSFYFGNYVLALERGHNIIKCQVPVRLLDRLSI